MGEDIEKLRDELEEAQATLRVRDKWRRNAGHLADAIPEDREKWETQRSKFTESVIHWMRRILELRRKILRRRT